MSITVVLADDHQIVRQGIRGLLENQPGIKIIGEASSGPQAIQMVRDQHPDVLVLDLSMPGLNGLAVTQELNEASPQTRIVIFSMHIHTVGYSLAGLGWLFGAAFGVGVGGSALYLGIALHRAIAEPLPSHCREPSSERL